MHTHTHTCASGHERLKRVLGPSELELRGGFGLPYVGLPTQDLVIQQEPLTTETSLLFAEDWEYEDTEYSRGVGAPICICSNRGGPSGQGEKNTLICLSLSREHLGTILKKCMRGWRDLSLSWRKQEAAADLSGEPCTSMTCLGKGMQ